MKAATTILHNGKNWNGSKFKQLFIYLTGYDIFFEGSRKDLVPIKVHSTD